MPDNNPAPATLFAIFAILVMLGMTGFIAWRAGVFGGAGYGPPSNALIFPGNSK